MNILVGPNATGKSTLLDIFAFLQTALLDDVEEAVRRRGRALRELVWQHEQIADGFELSLEMDIPAHLRTGTSDCVRYELKIGLDADGSLAIRAENLFLKETPAQPIDGVPAADAEGEIDDSRPIVRPSGSRIPMGYRRIIAKTAEGNSYFRSEKGKWNTLFKFPPLRLSLAGMPEDDSRFPIALWFKRALLDNVHLLQLDTRLMRRTTPADARRSFQTDGSNLPLVIADLRRQHPARFQWWIDHLKTILPDLTAVDVEERPEDRSLYLTVSYQSDLRVPAWLLSDGTLRLLGLTLIAYLPHENRIYLIEEPENGVHPRAIEAIFQSLSSVYSGQVFLATHSPLLLGLARPDQLLIFSKTPSGAAAIVRGSDHPLLTEWQRDLSLGSLFAAGVFG
jgi:predicted ATPase